jgi:hypothetical protein
MRDPPGGVEENDVVGSTEVLSLVVGGENAPRSGGQNCSRRERKRNKAARTRRMTKDGPSAHGWAGATSLMQRTEGDQDWMEA